jgi:protein-disulfide isomerase
LTDFECAACRSYQPTIDSLLASRAGYVRVVYVPLPLERLHRFALPAARAGECAAEDGHLAPWLKTMFAQQDSLGLKSWGTLAYIAGIADTARIAVCANSAVTPPRINSGREFAEELGVMATPTIIVNGWRYPRPPSISQLEKIVDAALKGPDEIAVED